MLILIFILYIAGAVLMSAFWLLFQIVWDPVKNRYVNKDEENSDDDAASDAKRDAPPPTDAEFRQKMLPAMSSAPVQNRGLFHRAKTRGMHIDVLSPVFTYYVGSIIDWNNFLF